MASIHSKRSELIKESTASTGSISFKLEAANGGKRAASRPGGGGEDRYRL